MGRKGYTYCLPHDATIEVLAEMYQLTRSDKYDYLIIDWSNCNKLSPESACVLRCMLKMPELKDVVFVNNQASPIFELFMFLLRFEADKVVADTDAKHFFLSSASDEETILSRRKMMLDYLHQFNILSNKDISGIEQIFGELYMNVCQHSGFKQGLVYIPDFSENNYISIIVVDLGKGIPDNIKSHFPEFKAMSDEDAIEFATNDWITTKSTPQNYGRGLAHLLSISDAIEGEVTIVSGAGKLVRTNSESHKFKFDGFFPGTMVHAKLDLCNFETREHLAFDEDVDF
jgi:anti-sigma regulatory factor (Ser/Thr protein kinase)